MGSLDGLRCLSMAWVIFGHTIVYSLPAGGLQFYAEILPKGFHVPGGSDADISIPPNGGRVSTVAYQLVPAAFFAVDSFFWMGGLLTGVALIGQMRRLGARWWKLYPVYVLGRWLRLTPLVGLAILWVIGIGPSLGDGPFWQTQHDAEQCAQSWWADILYVQNIRSLTDEHAPSCLAHFWYLSNDMQFFLLAPLLVFPYVLSPLLGWAVLTLAVSASTAANVAISIAGNYTASPLFDMKYFSHVYVQPYTRAQPYLVGVGLAFAWDAWTSKSRAEQKRRSDRASDASSTAQREAASVQCETPSVRREPAAEQEELKGASRLPPALVWSMVAASAAIMLADMFGTYGLYQHYPTDWGRAQNVSYIALSRLGWAIALSALAFLCFAGELPLLNSFLSCAPFEVLGKLTYAAYIVHPLIITPMAHGGVELVKFSDGWFASSFTTYLVWACGVALLLWLLVEKPSANLLAAGLAKLGVKGGGE